MRNSKKWIRGILCVLAVIMILWALDLALYPCTFMRNDIHTVTTKQRDVIILGTSNGKMDLDPDSMLEETGLTGHNLCVGGEYPSDAYYLTKLILEKQAPQKVIFELDPGYITTEKEKGNNYLLFYHEFPISLAKVQYFADIMMECDLRTLLFPEYEYSLSYELSKAKETLSQKLTGNYDVSLLKGKVQEYHENGHIEKYPVDAADFPSYTPVKFTVEDVQPGNMEYLEKLIELCKENEVEFICATMPLPVKTLRDDWEGYVEADKYFQKFFAEHQVKYYNFNTEYYDAFSHEDRYYVDYDGHMNGDSAREFSKIFGQMILEEDAAADDESE